LYGRREANRKERCQREAKEGRGCFSVLPTVLKQQEQLQRCLHVPQHRSRRTRPAAPAGIAALAVMAGFGAALAFQCCSVDSARASGRQAREFETAEEHEVELADGASRNLLLAAVADPRNWGGGLDVDVEDLDGLVDRRAGPFGAWTATQPVRETFSKAVTKAPALAATVQPFYVRTDIDVLEPRTRSAQVSKNSMEQSLWLVQHAVRRKCGFDLRYSSVQKSSSIESHTGSSSNSCGRFGVRRQLTRSLTSFLR
jgi:hypothetical protein